MVVIVGCMSDGADNPNGVAVREPRPNEKNLVQGTGIESQDLATVTDKMARGIMAVPEIANAQKPPQIVLLPMKNDTRLPFNKGFFVDEITKLLNQSAAGKVRFAARARGSKRTEEVTSDADPTIQRVNGADFILTGKLAEETTWTSEGTGHYVLYSFELVNPNTREIIWNGSHRIKKQANAHANR